MITDRSNSLAGAIPVSRRCDVGRVALGGNVWATDRSPRVRVGQETRGDSASHRVDWVSILRPGVDDASKSCNRTHEQRAVSWGLSFEAREGTLGASVDEVRPHPRCITRPGLGIRQSELAETDLEDEEPPPSSIVCPAPVERAPRSTRYSFTAPRRRETASQLMAADDLSSKPRTLVPPAF